MLVRQIEINLEDGSLSDWNRRDDGGDASH